MSLDEIKISRAIIEKYNKKLLDALDIDVAIVGAGPAGMCAAYYLAGAGKHVAIFERKLAVGGGMWGGGMMFNEIVVQEPAKKILDEFAITSSHYKDNYYTADSLEAVSALCLKAIQAGAKIFNGISAQDVMIRKDRIHGLVINWTSVDLVKMHVDPLTIKAKYVIDATGHDCEVARVAERKCGISLKTPTGKVVGEQSMWADVGEETTVTNSIEIYPGLYVVGMGANAVMGSPRMGPIFGGMLLSGEKVAKELIKKL